MDFEVPFDVMAAELVRAVRAHRSQTAFGRRIGVRPNTVYAWEAGRRWPTAARLFGAARKVGLEPVDALTRFYRTPPPWLAEVDPASAEGVAALLRDLRGHAPIVEVAKRAGRSRFAVSRWLSGDAEPRVPDLLRMVEACSLRVLDFVASWVDPSLLPTVAPAWARLEAHRRMVYEIPWTTAVLRALELTAYRALPTHDAAWLADRLGLPTADVAGWIQDLERSGRIRWDGTHFSPSEGGATVDTRRDPAAGRRLKAHWARVGLERLENESEGLFSYNVFTASEADHARLRELHLAYFRELRAVVAASTPAERVVVANIQLFPLDKR